MTKYGIWKCFRSRMWVEQHMVKRTSPFERSYGLNKRRCRVVRSRYDTTKIAEIWRADEYFVGTYGNTMAIKVLFSHYLIRHERGLWWDSWQTALFALIWYLQTKIQIKSYYIIELTSKYNLFDFPKNILITLYETHENKKYKCLFYTLMQWRSQGEVQGGLHCV